MKILILFVVIGLIAGCSSTKQVSDPLGDRVSPKYDESFDPNTLNDDDIVIAKIEPKVVEAENNNSENQLADGEIKFKEASGFRVQLVATKNIESATLTEQEAKDLFDTMKHKVYLIFDAPLYKVRVGDVINRNDADEIRDTAKDYGYREAFIVPSKVNVPLNDSF